MKHLYIPYSTSFDGASNTWCAEGVDRYGNAFGVGAGANEDRAKLALRVYVLESLLAGAADGDDFLRDLVDERPPGSAVVLTANDVLPVVLRLHRSRLQERQADLAQRLGMTQQAYAKLERPGCNPTLRTLVRLEEVFGASLITFA